MSRRVSWIWLLACMLLGCTGRLEAPEGSSLGADPAPAMAGLICQPGLAVCAGACVALDSSNEHCGNCGVACEAPTVCAAGVCGNACADGFSKCDSGCADLTRDSANCGACGKTCALGEPCVAGVCGCPEASLFCAGQCFEPLSDTLHCGACGNACATGSACIDGSCQCREGEISCSGQCTNLDDHAHCGSCDKACGAGEICAVDSCIPESSPCPGGLTRCGDACVDLQSSARACGTCGNVCPGAQVCSAGQCTCPAGKTACGGTCVDVQQSPLNCGACGTACSNGQVCRAGQCRCAGAEATVCAGACVVVDGDPNHCGACGVRCQGGLPCTNGKCACPEGETPCGGECVNTDSTPEHCGGCAMACPEGESCLAGECSGAIGDACANTLASGISIREIAIYQAGKVPLMRGGQPVPLGERPAEIIDEKAARMRVFVDLEPGFTERVLSARLLLTRGEDSPSYFSKRNVSQPSVENSFATTFNFDVTAEDVTSATRFAVEIVECGAAVANTPGRPRYPETDNAALETRETGVLKIHFVPLDANGRTASGDSERLEAYRTYIERMYPVTRVEYTLGAPLRIENSISPQGSGWTNALDQISNLHEQDDAPADVYYYGLFEPSERIEQFCGGGCVAGIGYVTGTQSFARHQHASLGLSFGTEGSARVLAHEIGHNHGRPHSPCGGASDADGGYPHAGAKIGWWGFQAPEKLHDPSTATDIMAYCKDQWVSDYVFRLFTDRVAYLNGARREIPPPGGMQHFRFMLVDEVSGPRWGVERRAPRYPTGTPELSTILDASGAAIASVTVYRTPTDHLAGALLLVPVPAPDWHSIQVAGHPPLAFAAPSSTP